jgi:hypothetical protein
MERRMESTQVVSDLRPDLRPQPGDSLIKISTAAEREDVSLATVWHKIRTDPQYPKPVYDAKGMARLIERQHSAYIAKTYSEQPKDRASRARIHRKKAA